jgi:cytochrome c peroxidase
LLAVFVVPVAWSPALPGDAGAATASAELAPLPPAPKVNKAAAELGRQLFFDVRLSGDVAISCSSCHDPSKAWGDDKPLADAYPGSLHFRNSKSLLNTAYNRFYFWDGHMGGDDPASMIRNEITETHILNLDGRIMQERMAQVPEYVALFDKAFGGEPSFGKTLKAVAAFTRTLVTRDAPLDRHLKGDSNALSASARRGLDLFTGKAGCSSCHNGPMLTDWQPHDLGVSEHPDVVGDPLRHITLRAVNKWFGVPNYENLRTDPGYYAVTKEETDRGAFVTPTLREVARTAPYMHNGTIASLEDVVAFYNKGAGPGSGLSPLRLRPAEQRDLVAFLKEGLTGKLPKVAIPESSPEYGIVPLGKPGGDLADLLRPDLEVNEAASTEPLAALPMTAPIPADNPQTDAKVELGKLLYFDTRLGGDASVSCASCHDPTLAWGEGSDVSRGYPGTVHWRNSQTIVNSAFYKKLFWAGSVTSLEKQAPSAAKGGVAGNGESEMMEERLRQIPEYVRRFKEVFGARPHIKDAWKAIAAFERTIIQPNTPFDNYMRGDKGAIDDSAKRGLALFDGKAGCSQCHSGSLLSDERFHRLGVPENPVFEEDPLRQITWRFEHYAKGVSEDLYRKTRTDLGLYYRSKRKEHIGKFRTPSLRYTKYTMPYMHNGAFFTLEEVIDFYNEGGGQDLPVTSSLLKPLGLSDTEKEDLLAFLETLSGEEIIVDPPELPPYEVMN